MYCAHFGLDRPPFRITPDPELFFPGGNRGAVLDALLYAVTSGEGIVKVVGEVGSGKTMLCRMLERELGKDVDIIYLANPSLAPEDALQAIALELGIDAGPGLGRVATMQQLQKCLLDRHARNRRVVMFVEEAQSMPIATLEEVRLLSNLETTQNKLLQIVLFGQPELDEHLADHTIRQLRERITHSFHLPPLTPLAVRDYVLARVRASGYRGPDLFSRGALAAIARYSRGLIRRINVLADKSLLAAFADGERAVRAPHVRRALRECEFALDSGRGPRLRVALAVLVLIIAGTITAYIALHPALTLRSAVIGASDQRRAPTADAATGSSTPAIGVAAGSTGATAEARTATAPSAPLRSDRESVPSGTAPAPEAQTFPLTNE